MKLPKTKDFSKFIQDLSDEDFTYILDDNASNVDKTKFDLCQNFIKYLRFKKCSQAELARLLEVDRSRVNWITKCRIEHFTIDRLYSLWNKIDPNFKLSGSA